MKFKLLSISFISALIILGIVLPFKANAVSQSSILVNVAPENPTPNENVSITLSSYASNLDSVLISWSVDGKTVLSGIGKKSFSLNAPAAGGETNVVASISLPDGAIDTRIIIRPAVMILLWQATDSYVPPFYRGKALPTPDSQIKVVAMPEIKSGSQMVDPKNMTYAWKKDYTNNVDGSGYGKNFFLYVNDYLDNSNNIGVIASTIDQKYSSQASIDIGTYQPKIDFYKNDATMGTLWEQALSDGHRVVGNEVVQAAPYFISPKDIRIPFLTFAWFINDYQIDVPTYSKNFMPLTVQAGTTGTSKVRLDISSTEKIFETASKEINVNF
jgi:hypothetical protein